MSLPSWQIQPWGYSAFMQTPFRLDPQTNQLLHNNHVITVYSIIRNNIDGGAWNGSHMLDTTFDVPSTNQQQSWSEYRINNHLTRVQTQLTGHRQNKCWKQITVCKQLHLLSF